MNLTSAGVNRTFDRSVDAAAVIVRYVWILSHLLRGEEPEQIDLTKSSSGL